jgi:hypothetical protein
MFITYIFCAIDEWEVAVVALTPSVIFPLQTTVNFPTILQCPTTLAPLPNLKNGYRQKQGWRIKRPQRLGRRLGEARRRTSRAYALPERSIAIYSRLTHHVQKQQQETSAPPPPPAPEPKLTRAERKARHQEANAQLWASA